MGYVALHAPGCRAGCNLRVGEALLVEQSFFRASRFETLGEEECVGGDAQCGMVMKSSPAASLEMGQAELLLQFLIIPFEIQRCLPKRSAVSSY